MSFLFKSTCFLLFLASFGQANGQCSYNSALDGQNMVINGDFSSGNTGFTSDFSFSNVNPLMDGNYTITTNGASIHFGYAGFDHTTGTGNFLAINHGSNVSTSWKQTISVQPNSNYNFSAWFRNIVNKTLYPGLAYAKVELWINNSKVSNNLTLTDFPDEWKLIETSWNSGSNITAVLEIKNLETATNGNDFAIDDVSFKQCCQTKVNLGLDKIICPGDSVQIQADGSGNFLWNTAPGIQNLSVCCPFVNPKNTTDYIVTRTNGFCISKDTIKIQINPISISLSENKNICVGDSIQIFSNPISVNDFVWIPNIEISDTNAMNPWIKPTNSRTYYFIASNANCTIKDSISIKIYSKENYSIIQDTGICVGEQIRLFVNGGDNWQWLNPYELTGQNLFNPLISPKTDTVYYVKIGFGNCFLFDTINVKAKPNPKPFAGRDTFHCADKSVQISGYSNGSGQLNWKTNPYFIDTINLPHSVSVKGSYQFILIERNNNCINYDTVLIEEKTKPIAAFDLDPIVAYIPMDVNITNKSSSPAVYQWFMNKQFISGTMTDSILKVFEPNDYNLSLIVTNEFGCKDSINKTFKALFEPKLKIPNVFTPNNDGVNDEFKIEFTEGGFNLIEYEIYNRWGQLLYVAKIPETKWWNGESNGKECSPGVYFFIFHAKTINGKTFNSRGTVTLIR